MKQRLRKVMQSAGATAETPLYFTSLAGFNLMAGSDDAAELERLIQEVGAALVICDALVDLAAGGDENSARDMHHVFSTVRGIANRTQAAFLLIHHTGKDGRYRGSSAMLGAMDTMLMLEPGNPAKTLKLSVAKARDSEPFDLGLELKVGDECVTLERYMGEASHRKSPRPSTSLPTCSSMGPVA
jgi:hypothetical protein